MVNCKGRATYVNVWFPAPDYITAKSLARPQPLFTCSRYLFSLGVYLKPEKEEGLEQRLFV